MQCSAVQRRVAQLIVITGQITFLIYSGGDLCQYQRSTTPCWMQLLMLGLFGAPFCVSMFSARRAVTSA